MATVSVRLPDEKHERLKQMTKRYGVSPNELLEELATAALAELDVETRCRVRAGRGSAERGLAILGKLEAADPARTGDRGSSDRRPESPPSGSSRPDRREGRRG